MPRKNSPERLAQITAWLTDTTLTNPEIAALMKCSIRNITYYRNYYKIPTPIIVKASRRQTPKKTADYAKAKKLLSDPTITNATAAKILKVTYDTILRYRKVLEIPPANHPGRTGQGVTSLADHHKEIMALVKEGKTVTEISKITHLNRISLYDYLRRHKIPSTNMERLEATVNNFQAGTSEDRYMEYVDRGTKQGFNFYWQRRPYHFEDVYGMPWSEGNAHQAFMEYKGEGR